MNQSEQVLLQAIQKTLWNKDITVPEDADWNAMMAEAKKQTVLGFAICAAPDEIRAKWKSKADSETAHFIRILHFQSALYNLLKANGIPMVILKGTAAAQYYPAPLQRTSGDIDFLVPGECVEEAKTVLAANGYEIEDDPQYPRHIDVRKDGISFEMHRFFSDGESDVEIDRYLLDGLSRAEESSVYGVAFPTLPPMENGLTLLTHIAHHLRVGLGLRQVMDWMMFVDKVLDDEAWRDSFRDTARRTGLETLALTVTKMCRMYLGLSDRITWCSDADDALCSVLMEDLLSSGNFGIKRGTGIKVESAVSHLKRKGFRYLQQAGEYNWKAYHKHRWLKPFAWIYQICRYGKQGIQEKRNGSHIMESIDRGKQRSELYQRLRIGKPEE